jgi:haloacetate dehalogenase
MDHVNGSVTRLEDAVVRVDAGGIELTCLDAGEGPPIVCIHGWPQHSACWRRLGAHLATRYRVVAPDLRGCGDSPVAVDGFDKKTLAADIAAVMASLGIGPCAVAGHDWGAPVAYRLALDYPELVSALVILNGRMPLVSSHNTLMYAPTHAPERWYFHFNRIPELPERMIGASLRTFLDYFLDHWSAEPSVFTRQDRDELVRVHARPGGLTAGLGLYRTALEQDAADWREHAGATIEVPTLVLWGAGDPVLTLDYLDGLESVVRDVRIHVNDDAGHFLQEEAPAWCAERIDAFLTECAR